MIHKPYCLDTLSEPNEPTRLGYLFAGWFKDRNHTEEWNFITGKVESNMTLYAKWNVISEDYHIVHFVSNFDIEVPSQQVLKGSALTAPNITREGYTLEGWYTSLNNGATLDERWSFTTNVVNTNFTLYAKWAINQYTITFNSNGGSAVNPITRDYGMPSINHKIHSSQVMFLVDGTVIHRLRQHLSSILCQPQI